MPAHRIVFTLRGDTLIEMTGAGPAETLLGYREMDGWVPGMIAWPKTVLLEGAEPIAVDPGYQTQGDMLVGALAGRDLATTDTRTVVMTHLHYDHITAVQQLGPVDLFVRADELETPMRNASAATSTTRASTCSNVRRARSDRGCGGFTRQGIPLATSRCSSTPRMGSW